MLCFRTKRRCQHGNAVPVVAKTSQIGFIFISSKYCLRQSIPPSDHPARTEYPETRKCMNNGPDLTIDERRQALGKALAQCASENGHGWPMATPDVSARLLTSATRAFRLCPVVAPHFCRVRTRDIPPSPSTSIRITHNIATDQMTPAAPSLESISDHSQTEQCKISLHCGVVSCWHTRSLVLESTGGDAGGS